jgi:CubicO group peptidase (beta-lactamase class C family)
MTIGRFLLLIVCAAQLRALELAPLESYYRKALKDWNVPGFSVVIVQGDEILLAKGFGVREMGKAERVDDHTLFAIASNTKAFTTASMAILVQQKKLGWEDPVRQYLPYFEIFQNPWLSSEARIDDLLCHRLGFKTFSGDLIWWGTSYSSEEVVRRARFLKPQYGLRRGFGYSNIMFIAAGEVIEHVSGKPWREFVQQQLLDPLQMTNTVLSVRALKSRNDVATPHGNDGGKPFPIPWTEWESTAAAGGIISCASDLGQWLRLQLAQGKLNGRTFYTEKEAWKMWALHNPINPDKNGREKYPEFSLGGAALGWFVADYNGLFSARHGGGYDGMFSETMMVPSKKVGVVILSNSMTGLPQALARYTIDALLGNTPRDWSGEGAKKAADDRKNKAKEKKRTSHPEFKPSLPLGDYAARYGGAMYGEATISLEGDHLVLQILPNPELVADLKHLEHDLFEVNWRKKFAFFGSGTIHFSIDEKSQASEFKLNVPNDDFWFDELEFKRR